VLYTLTQNQC